MAINNTLGTNRGLVGLSPFLQGSIPSTSGTTTQPFNMTSGLGVSGTDQTKPFTQSTSGTIPLGQLNGLISLPPNPVSSSQSERGFQQFINPNGNNGSISPPPNPYGAGGTATNNAQSGGIALQPGQTMDASGKIVNGTQPGNQTGSQSGLIPPPNPQNNAYTNTGAPGFSQTVGALASTASQPSAAFTQAQQTAQDALKQLEESRSNEANALALNSSNPIPLEFQQGRGQVLQQQYLSQQNALAGEYQGAVGLENAATGQQGTQQTGLNEAGNLGQPQQAGPTNVPFNPLNNTYGTPAAGAYGAGGSNGLQNVGGITGQMNVGQQVTQLNSYLGGAQVVGNNLNDLITANNINPTGLTYANGALQFGKSAMSNPAYQKFAGQINDFVSSLAPILGTGGSVTDMKTQMSSQIVNALQSGSTIKDVVSYFLDQAKQKIGGLSSGGGAGVGTAGNNTSNKSGLTFGKFF